MNMRVISASEAVEARRVARADFEELLGRAGVVVPETYLNRWWPESERVS